ncbi:MerR family transcriptional regulator [Saccharomonospora viridis]|jgi:MerR family transcriptional regulator/heat shock protein HspR|uniref:Predicted transcriptional regulator n=2 Tax=Saccharomonospora viridis TaxID=1852 RepID=C7MX90_SACVD|nr:MerR family transcriptional regulator [Saccharomonospora viridis]ACU95899.1 predicted transcriptional regulator [Saccharomonospora viridis DSM 43017]KHF45607.1 transcriptional regulator [Saccharomonospora viridis]SFP73060.1 DNA-binding transcriptional regulator, MerR family [Saccharomonospora viridis]
MNLRKLDDEHYPAFSTGQAAELLGVEQPFLRSLDNAGVVTPQRSSGGHRRYSRYQLSVASRLRELFDEGHTLTSAQRILRLETELTEAKAEIARLKERLRELGDDVDPDDHSEGPTGDSTE